MGADKSRHNGAAPKNSPWPRRRKRCWCDSAMETPPCSQVPFPVSLQDLMERMAPRGACRGSKLLKHLGRPALQLPRHYCPNGAVPQLMEMLVEHPQDAITAFHLAKRSAKLQETCTNITANTLKDTHIHACTMQPAALSPWLQRPSSTSATL